MKRVVDLSGAQEVFRVRIDKGCLLISHGLEEHPEETRIPAPEVEVLILGPRLALTGAVLSLVVASGGAVLSIDDRFRPVGLMLPIVGNTLHAERLRIQIEETPRSADRIWKEVVTAKIVAQANNLHEEEPHEKLLRLAARVEPGDPQNLEAQAARLYWPSLFGEAFTRSSEVPENIKLNYGYAVLRAVVARAICAAGLHPTLGIKHKSRLNPFALADDLMEVARPLVDAAVEEGEFNRAAKQRLLSALTADVAIGGEKRSLSDAYSITVRSFFEALRGGGLLLPAAA